jgi:adenine-specific DNA-methyltransferase
MPIFSNYYTQNHIYQEDTNKLVLRLPFVDLAYIDPPYNQHPYGSNYFMLNVLNEYKRPIDISDISGIPKKWKRSDYNKEQKARDAMLDLCKNIRARYLLVSFNSEGFIRFDDMMDLLRGIGTVEVMETEYNTFRGCRNLKDREIHVNEYLYLVQKG